jgi:hypothetical protein
MDEDAQALEEPIIPRVEAKQVEVAEKDQLEMKAGGLGGCTLSRGVSDWVHGPPPYWLSSVEPCFEVFPLLVQFLTSSPLHPHARRG